MERGDCDGLPRTCFEISQFRVAGKAGSNLSVFCSSGNAQVGHLEKRNCGIRL